MSSIKKLVRYRKTGVLYITYDGILEPLGQSQVVQYQERLSQTRKIVLISFEKQEDWQRVDQREAFRNQIRGVGIIWIPLRYHKHPSSLATAYDIAQGVVVGILAIIHHQINIVHARSYVASVIAIGLKKLFKLKYIFDMRGFWADERVDGGLWPRGGTLFQVAKRFERHFLLNADFVVSLTHAAVDEMQKFPYLRGRMPNFTVIPTCTDLSRFVPIRIERPGNFVLGCVGSVGTWYMFDEMLVAFKLLLQLRPNARFMIVNRGEHAFIENRILSAGLSRNTVEIYSATHTEVPRLMARMDAALFFIKPVFSKKASTPTKLGEFLGCGIPCLGNVGVGDMTSVLEGEKVGVSIKAFDDQSITSGLHCLLKLVEDRDTPARCVAAAQKHFSLIEGVHKYEMIYKKLESQDI